MLLHLHDFFPAGKHYVQTEVFPSFLLARKIAGEKD